MRSFPAPQDSLGRSQPHRLSQMGLLLAVPGWQDAFTELPAGRLVDEQLRMHCKCDTPLQLEAGVLVACEACHRFFLYIDADEPRLFVTYGEETEPD